MKTALRLKSVEKRHSSLVWVQLLLTLLFTPLAFAHDGQNQSVQAEFSQQELDQMLAPIALYPDALLSQVLIASTYPLEVVQAARWSRAHAELRGEDAVKAVERNNWDPSVISLVAFPQVLAQMDDKLDWTERLGDAFLGQQEQVSDTVQHLRQKASDAGNLQSNSQVHVYPQGQTIIIEQAAPQVIYVPYYNPTVVYGPWWWDAYPPVYWSPWPGYYQPGFSTTFYWGNGISISSGFFFSNFDWHQRHVNIVNVNNYYYNNYYANPRHSNPYNLVQDGRDRQSGAVRDQASGNDSAHEWRHDPGHRRGVPYREPALQQQFGRANADFGTRRDFQNRDATSRGSNGQTRSETGTRSGTDTSPRIHGEEQGNVQTPNSSPVDRGNKADRQDGRGRRDNSTRQNNAASVNQPEVGGNPNAEGSASRNPDRSGKSDRSNRSNRPDSGHVEMSSPVPTTAPPELNSTPQTQTTAPPVTRTPDQSGNATRGELRESGRRQPDTQPAAIERTAPMQRPNVNSEARGSNNGNQPRARDNGDANQETHHGNGRNDNNQGNRVRKNDGGDPSGQ